MNNKSKFMNMILKLQDDYNVPKTFTDELIKVVTNLTFNEKLNAEQSMIRYLNKDKR
jgi:predicted DNA binding CopG/RHH family protein